MTRIAIAAPSAVIRAGLEALLAATPGWEVAGSFADASSLESLQLDVLVAALPVSELPVVSGAVPAIVLLTSEGQPEWTAEALRSGVRALLPRDAPAAAILAAVEAAANGLAVIDPQELEGLLGSPGMAEPRRHGRRRAHPARDGSASDDGRWRRQQGDRVEIGHFRAHREVPCGVGYGETERFQPDGSSDARAAAGVDSDVGGAEAGRAYFMDFAPLRPRLRRAVN